MSRIAKGVVPPPPERAQNLPINQLLVLRLGSGFATYDTQYGTRPAFGVHAFKVGRDTAEYLGHINVFWEAVIGQLQQALTTKDVALVCYIVQNGRRYELRGVEPEHEDRALAAVESVLSEPTADTPEDAPFQGDDEPPPPIPF